MLSVVSVLFAKGVEGAISLAAVGWSKVFSMDDCSLCLRELLVMSDCTTSCINRGISSRVNGVPLLFPALLESLPLPQERADMPRVGRCFVLLIAVLPPCNCGSVVSRLLFWHSCLIPRRQNAKDFYLSQHSSLGWRACQ